MRFGRRGLPELVHEFPIDPPAVPFISDKSLARPPSSAPRLPSHPPTPPHPAAEKSPMLHPRSAPPVGPPPEAARPAPPVTALLPHAGTHTHTHTHSRSLSRCTSSLPPWGGDASRPKAADGGRRKAGLEGLPRQPRPLRGSGHRALPSAPTGPPGATCWLWRSPWDLGEGRARRGSPRRSPM